MLWANWNDLEHGPDVSGWVRRWRTMQDMFPEWILHVEWVPEHATMFYAWNESLMHEVQGELIWVDGGGCAASTINRDVGTQWVHDAGQSWWGMGMVHTRVNVCWCMQQHVGGKALAGNVWGCLVGCWGVQWLCRWVLDVTRSLGKIHGSGGVGMGCDIFQTPYVDLPIHCSKIPSSLAVYD